METLPKTQNTFLAYLLILIAFFIILFFTRNIFAELQVSLDTKEQLAQDISEKEKTLAGLNDIQTKLSQEGSTQLQEIQGFLGSFSDADLLEYIYSYAQKINLGSERIIIRDISLTEQGQSDIGFHTAQIQISALFSSEATLLAFTDFLTAKNGKYQFYLTTFEYPMNSVSGNIQVSLPLTLYYKK